MISNDRRTEKPRFPVSTKGYLQSYLLGAFGSGREALIALFKSRNLEACTVMLPGFLPQGIIAPLKHLRCKLIFYRSDSYGNPDIKHISDLLNEGRPEVFFLLHYFGVKRDTRELVELLSTNKTLVIEDFAQSFPDKKYIRKYPENLFLVSLPKLFGIPDGGLFMGSKHQVPFKTITRTIGARLYTYLRRISLRFAKPATSGYIDRYVKYLSAVFSILSYKVLMRSFTKPSAQSSYSEGLYRRADLRKGIARRSEFAAEYLRRLNNEKVTIHPGLNPADNVLMGFPVYVENRTTFHRYLLGNGIKPLVFAEAWGYLPKDLESSFRETLEFRDKHVLLPLSHHLTHSHIDNVIRVVNQYPG